MNYFRIHIKINIPEVIQDNVFNHSIYDESSCLKNAMTTNSIKIAKNGII